MFNFVFQIFETLKLSLILLLFFSLDGWAQSSYRNPHPIYNVSVSYQNEDIFTSIGAGFQFRTPLILELRYGVGTRRAFFQQAWFSKFDLLVHGDVLKSNRWILGPSIQFSVMRLSSQFLNPIQKYTAAELGYYFAVGNQLKLMQSMYFGRATTHFAPKINRYNYWGYSFQIGLMYEI